MLSRSKRTGRRPNTKSFVNLEEQTELKLLDQAKYFQNELEQHTKIKPKPDIKEEKKQNRFQKLFNKDDNKLV